MPVPEGPSITQISPAGMVRVTSPQISCLPNDLVRSLTWISTPMSSSLSSVRATLRPIDARGTLVATLTSNNAHCAVRLRMIARRHVTSGPGVADQAVLGHRVWVGTAATTCADATTAADRDGDGGRRRCRRGRAPLHAAGDVRHLRVTVAPAPSSASLALSAVSLLTFSRIALGAASTSSLASFRPSEVRRAHLLDDVDLLVAGGLEDDVELVLLGGLLGSRRRHRPRRARRPRRRGRRR